ncbi:MAG: hypothetical protein M0036_23270 [Desulfobacteraceae bacterium]|nr:hypothetical protein [Desulfobacteraceae bacterium]
MKQLFFRFLLIILVAALTACGDTPKDYAGRAEIQQDLDRLFKAKENGDEATMLEVSQRLLSSKQTIGAARIMPLLYRAEVLARHGKTEEVNALFDKQFAFVMKSSGSCSQSAFISMKAEVWQEAGRLDLAVTDYNSAIEKCPQMDNAYSKLSLLHSSGSDPKYIDVEKALALAQKAVDVNGASKALNALATANAAAGQYALAAENMAKAIAAAEKERQSPIQIESFRNRLSSYQNKAGK